MGAESSKGESPNTRSPKGSATKLPPTRTQPPPISTGKSDITSAQGDSPKPHTPRVQFSIEHRSPAPPTVDDDGELTGPSLSTFSGPDSSHIGPYSSIGSVSSAGRRSEQTSSASTARSSAKSEWSAYGEPSRSGSMMNVETSNDFEDVLERTVTLAPGRKLSATPATLDEASELESPRVGEAPADAAPLSEVAAAPPPAPPARVDSAPPPTPPLARSSTELLAAAAENARQRSARKGSPLKSSSNMLVRKGAPALTTGASQLQGLVKAAQSQSDAQARQEEVLAQQLLRHWTPKRKRQLRSIGFLVRAFRPERPLADFASFIPRVVHQQFIDDGAMMPEGRIIFRPEEASRTIEVRAPPLGPSDDGAAPLLPRSLLTCLLYTSPSPRDS